MVLLVDDEEMVRELVRHFLGGAGYTVVVAGSGEEARAVAREHGTAIRLLVSDVMLQDVNGATLGHELRALIPGLKIIYISGFSDEAAWRDISAQPGTLFIAKPFTRQSLLTSVRSLLDSDAPSA